MRRAGRRPALAAPDSASAPPPPGPYLTRPDPAAVPRPRRAPRWRLPRQHVSACPAVQRRRQPRQFRSG